MLRLTAPLKAKGCLREGGRAGAGTDARGTGGGRGRGAREHAAELWQALGACARRARVAPEAAGSEVTVLFTLKRDGNLQGKSRITYSRLIGKTVDQQASVAASLAAIAGCFPIPVTEGLGGAIAGRPIRFRLVSAWHDV